MRRLLRSVTASAASSSARACLDLDEDQIAAAAGHDVDFAERRFPAPRQDAIGLGDEQHGGAAFRRKAELKRRHALLAGRGFGLARSSLAPCGIARFSSTRHGRLLSPARARAGRGRGAASRSRRRLPPTASFSETRASAWRSRVSVSSALGISAAGGGAMTRTNSPRISPAAPLCASASRSPRRTSSCSLVSSRQMAASRAPSPAARSASVAAIRGPVSNSTIVEGTRASSAMRARRAACLGGRKPANKNWSVGRPAIGQGREHGRRPRQRRDRMAGVLGGAHQLVSRVGDKRRAGVRYERNRGAFGQPPQQRRPRLRGIVVVIGRERGCDAVAVEQLAGYARVFTGNEVGAGQRR